MAGWELNARERGPEIFSYGGWDGFLAVVWELTQSFVVLSFVSNSFNGTHRAAEYDRSN